jgi:hypothetical protein
MINGGSTCPFPLQRRDLADPAGLARVHVARTLESLRERRLAEIQNGTLVIFDRPRLTDLRDSTKPDPAAKRGIGPVLHSRRVFVFPGLQ